MSPSNKYVVSKEAVASQSSINNPYVKGAEGRKEWNDRYMNMVKAIRNWQIAFASSIAVCIVLSLVVARIATESHVEPFIVETNAGMPYAIKSMQTGSMKDERIVNFAVNQFINNARTVLADSDAEKNLLNNVYAYAADNTLDYLKDYYAQNNPLLAISKYTTSVNIVNSMPLSANTWQVTWDETKRSSTSGQIMSVTRYMADLSYKFGDVNPQFQNSNPFGFYITDVSWSQSQS